MVEVYVRGTRKSYIEHGRIDPANYNRFGALIDTCVLLEEIGDLKTLHHEHPGDVFITNDIWKEICHIGTKPKEWREEKGINIPDYKAFKREVYANTLNINREPFSMPTLGDLRSSQNGDEKRVARIIETAAERSYSKCRLARKPSEADMSLLVAPVLGNGKSERLWLAVTHDQRLIDAGNDLNGLPYPVVPQNSIEDARYFIERYF